MKIKRLFLGFLLTWILAIVTSVALAPNMNQVANTYYKVADFLRTFLPIVLGLIILVKLSQSFKRLNINHQNVSTIIPLIIGIYVYWIFYPLFESSFSNYRELIRSFALFPLQVNSDSAIFSVINHSLYTDGATILSQLVIGVGFPLPALILGTLSTLTSFIGLIYLKKTWTHLNMRRS